MKRSESAETESTKSAFFKAVRLSQMVITSDAHIERLTERISSIGVNSSPKFSNLLTRNLLIGVGWNASMRRAGDTNVRMDLIAQNKSLIFVTEVEFSDAVIDAPRSVLDGISVLKMRYGLNINLISGLVVVYALPNQRSEYWHVISDIEKILNVRIYTISAAALILLLWEGCTLNWLPFVSLEKTSIRSDIEKNLNRNLSLTLGIAAALEVPK